MLLFDINPPYIRTFLQEIVGVYPSFTFFFIFFVFVFICSIIMANKDVYIPFYKCVLYASHSANQKLYKTGWCSAILRAANWLQKLSNVRNGLLRTIFKY